MMIRSRYFFAIFHDFPWPILKSQDFPSLENEILKLHAFPGFPWIRTNPVTIKISFRMEKAR